MLSRALLKVTNCCYQAKGMLAENAADDKKFAKRAAQPLKHLVQMTKLLSKCKKTTRKGVAFNLVQEADKLVNMYYSMIDDMRSTVPAGSMLK